MKNKITKEFFKDVLVYSVGTLFISIVTIIPLFLLAGILKVWIKDHGILNVLISFLSISVSTGLFVSLMILARNTLNKKRFEIEE